MSNFGLFLSPSSLAGHSRHELAPPFSPHTRSPKSSLEVSIAHHGHYIQPVPPMYVTEYEDHYCRSPKYINPALPMSVVTEYEEDHHSPVGTVIRSLKSPMVLPFSPGGSDSSSPNSALAHSISLHEHYIKPVPPMYVTEYEDRYRDPRYGYSVSSSQPKST